MTRYLARHIEDGLLVTNTEAWAWFHLPRVSCQYSSAETYETHAHSLTQALTEVIPDTGELRIQLRIVRRPFDVDAWEQRIRTKAGGSDIATHMRENYLTKAGNYLHSRDYNETAIFLGILLEQPETTDEKSGWSKFRSILGAAVDGNDPAINDTQLDNHRHEVDRILAGLTRYYDDVDLATAQELVWLLRKPFWDTTNCPSADIPDSEQFTANHISGLLEETVHIRERHLLVGEPGAQTFTTFASIDGHPGQVNWPQQLSWYSVITGADPGIEANICATIVPPREVLKRLNKLRASVNEEAIESEEYRTSDARDRFDHVARVEEKVKREQVKNSGWVQMTCRVQLRASSEEELAAKRRSLAKTMKEHGYLLQVPAHDQYALINEALPGGAWKNDLHQVSYDLDAVGATGGLLDFSVGDDDQAGMYLGYTLMGESTPVLFDPNRACDTNNPPGVLITGVPGSGKALALDTPIPTPAGWTTMGDLTVGSVVLDEKGNWCSVTFITETMHDHECFNVEFDDGTNIIADAEHQWVASPPGENERQVNTTDMTAGWRIYRPLGNTFFTITSITPTASVPVKCITVNSPSHLYLAGPGAIPTHNTFATLTLAYQAFLMGNTVAYIDPKADSDDLAMWIGPENINYIDMTAADAGLLDPFVMTESLQGSDDPQLAFNSVVGVCTMLTGIQGERAHKDAINSAVRSVIDEALITGGRVTMGHLVRYLLSQSDQASRSLGAELSGFQNDSYGRLLFSDGGAQLQPTAGKFTIIVLNGLQVPDQDTAREDYTPENRVAMAVMYLVMTYAQKLMMSDSLTQSAGHRVQSRKTILMDEAWTMFATQEGRSAAKSLLKLGRSMGTSCVFVTQKLSDIPKSSTYISTYMTFSPGTDTEQVHEAMDAVNLVADPQEMLDLAGKEGRGRCFFRDVSGRKALIQVDAWDRELFDVLDTTPGRDKHND